MELVWNRDDVHNQDLSETWFKKIGSFEAIAENVLVGKLKLPRSLIMCPVELFCLLKCYWSFCCAFYY